MSRQLAVIDPQFGDLSPIDGSCRNVQRALGKADRRLLTDAIQQFAVYVDPAGETSTRPGMAYRNMTTMVYRPAGLNALQRRAKAAGENARDVMSESELEFLRVAERTTADLLRLGMVEGKAAGENARDGRGGSAPIAANGGAACRHCQSVDSVRAGR
jgi:hypothetical protein